MLTVRVIEASGLEQVREVRSVMLRPAKESLTGSPCLTYFMDSNEGWSNSVDVYEGTAYVMNENGKTVASYFLGNLPRTLYVEEISSEEDKIRDNSKKKKSYSADDEIRFLFVETLIKPNKENDIMSISLIRLMPVVGREYNRQLVYSESYPSENVLSQSKIVKRIFYDFACDFVGLNVSGVGIGLYDALTQVTPDEERGIEYEPMTIVKNLDLNIPEKAKQDLIDRTIGMDANPVVFPIGGGSIEIFSAFARAFRKSLSQ
jgi:hypothetical protein